MTFGISATTALAAATAASGYLGYKASKDATKAQVGAARDALAQEREMYDISRADLEPYRETGYTALKEVCTKTICAPASKCMKPTIMTMWSSLKTMKYMLTQPWPLG